MTSAFFEEARALEDSKDLDAPGGFDDEKYEALLKLIIKSGGKLKPE